MKLAVDWFAERNALAFVVFYRKSCFPINLVEVIRGSVMIAMWMKKIARKIFIHSSKSISSHNVNQTDYAFMAFTQFSTTDVMKIK